MNKKMAADTNYKLHYELLLALHAPEVNAVKAETLLAILQNNPAIEQVLIWKQQKDKFSAIASSFQSEDLVSLSAPLLLIQQEFGAKKSLSFQDLKTKTSKLLPASLPFDEQTVFIQLQNFGLLYLQLKPNVVPDTQAFCESLLPALDQWALQLCSNAEAMDTSVLSSQPQAEEQHPIHQQHFHEILYLSEIGTFEYYPEEQRIKLSAKAMEFFGAGHSSGEFSYERYIQDFVPEHTQKEVHFHIQKTITENKFLDLDTRLKRKDGSTFYANIKLATKNQNGTNSLAYGSIKDITEQYRYLKSLRISENNLKEAQALAKIGSYDFDVEKNKINWSQETYKIFGMDPNLPEPTYEEYRKNLVHPDDEKVFYQQVDQAILSGNSFEIESRQLKTDGSIIYTINHGKILKKDGKVARIVGTTQDITERKLAEKKILESSLKYTQLFNNLYDAVVVTDMNGRMVDCNKSAQKMLGYSADELRNLFIPDIVHPDDMERSQEYLKKLVSQGYYSDYQGRILRKDGQVLYVQVNSNAIYENGELIGSRDIVRDITELKKAEQKREELLVELEQVNQELGDFAYVVSHDLKAPLRAISSLSQWLYEDNQGKLNPEGNEQLKLLINRSNRMHNFIEAILEYSRIGRIQLKEEWIDLSLLVEEIEDILVLPDHMQIQIGQKLPKFYGQKARLIQIFQNLIGNAIKYNDKEKGRIYINWEDIGSHLKFTISDNGPGIDPKYHEKIFKIFQTLHSRDDIESTGIGLTIVKRVVQLYEGEIKVFSVPGESTTFEFTLKKL